MAANFFAEGDERNGERCGPMMRRRRAMPARRRFCTFVGAGVVLGRVALAQSPVKVHRVGILSIGSDPRRPLAWDPFVEALRRLGYIEGRNLTLIRAHGGGNFDLMEPLLRDLLDKRPDVIAVSGIREVRAARKATVSIPIVMTQMPSDPVAEGLVESLARPGGNVTGFMMLVPGIYQKYVEILTEAVPLAKHIASLTSPPNPTPLVRQELESAARVRRVDLTVAHVNESGAIDPTVADLKRTGVQGLILPLDGFTIRHRESLVHSIARHKLPAIYASRIHIDVGGLMCYGTSITDLMTRAADYVDRILRGASPGTLPVQQPTRFKLIVNLKAAASLGLTLPPTIMVRADEVIR